MSFRRVCLLLTLFLGVSTIVHASDISLNCLMSGTTSNGKKVMQISNSNFMASISSGASYLIINVDDGDGKAFISVSSEKSADSISSNLSNESQYNLSEQYESFGMKGFERVQINRKTGAARFYKEFVSKGTKIDFHLSGICKKIEANKF